VIGQEHADFSVIFNAPLFQLLTILGLSSHSFKHILQQKLREFHSNPGKEHHMELALVIPYSGRASCKLFYLKKYM